MLSDPLLYEAWYHTRRGAWIGEREAALLHSWMRPVAGQTLLDVGCGTGYFTRRFAQADLAVTGIDPDARMVARAHALGGPIEYLEARAEALPFEDGRFDYAVAVTSLCFVADPLAALAEMWRVSRQGIALGLLNRRSLLYARKHDTGSYEGARWDTWPPVRRWIDALAPAAAKVRHGTAIMLPGGGWIARLFEPFLSPWSPWGGFLAVYAGKKGSKE